MTRLARHCERHTDKAASLYLPASLNTRISMHISASNHWIIGNNHRAKGIGDRAVKLSLIPV